MTSLLHSQAEQLFSHPLLKGTQIAFEKTPQGEFKIKEQNDTVEHSTFSGQLNLGDFQ